MTTAHDASDACPPGFWEGLAFLGGREASRRDHAGELLEAGFSAGEALDILLAEAAGFDAGDWQPHVLKRGPRKGQTVYKNQVTGAYRDEPPGEKKAKKGKDGGDAAPVPPGKGAKPEPKPEPRPEKKGQKDGQPKDGGAKDGGAKAPASSGPWGAHLPPSALQGKELPAKEVEDGIVRAMGIHRQFKESQDGVVNIARLWDTAKHYQPDLTVGQFHRVLDAMSQSDRLELYGMDSPGKVPDKDKALYLTRPQGGGGEGRTYEYAALPRPKEEPRKDEPKPEPKKEEPRKDDAKGGSASPGGGLPPVPGKAGEPMTKRDVEEQHGILSNALGALKEAGTFMAAGSHAMAQLGHAITNPITSALVVACTDYHKDVQKETMDLVDRYGSVGGHLIAATGTALTAMIPLTGTLIEMQSMGRWISRAPAMMLGEAAMGLARGTSAAASLASSGLSAVGSAIGSGLSALWSALGGKPKEQARDAGGKDGKDGKEGKAGFGRDAVLLAEAVAAAGRPARFADGLPPPEVVAREARALAARLKASWEAALQKHVTMDEAQKKAVAAINGVLARARGGKGAA